MTSRAEGGGGVVSQLSEEHHRSNETVNETVKEQMNKIKPKKRLSNGWKSKVNLVDAIADEKTGIGRLDHSDWMNYLQAKAVRIKIRGINKNLNRKRVWYARVKASKYAKRKGIGIIEDEYGVKVTNGVANVIMCNFGFSSTNGQTVKTSDGVKKITLRKGEPLVVVSVYDEMTDEEIKEDRKVKAMRASLRKKRFNQLKALAMKATECQREPHKTSDGEKTDEVSKDEETNDDIMGFVPQSYFDELGGVAL